MEHLVLRADTPNINGVVYSKEVLESAVEKFNNDHSQYAVICELIPTFTRDSDRGFSVDVERVSHQIHSLRMDGNNMMAKITPAGPMKNLVEELLSHDYVFRAFGTGDLNDGVVSNYQLVGVGVYHKDDVL